MSLWPRDLLRVAISPRQISLLRLGRGPWLRIKARKTLASPALGGKPGWQASLVMLAEALREPAWQQTELEIILSNHFVHYLLVPWDEEIHQPAEVAAHARLHFSHTYGPLADHWEIRCSTTRPGQPRLASALDPQLLEDLRALGKSSGLSLCSIQPYLMTAFNQCRRHCKGKSFWFVLSEPGKLCATLLHQGSWHSLRWSNCGEDGLMALPAMLAREAYLSELPKLPRQIYFLGPVQSRATLSIPQPWQLRFLQPAWPGLVFS